jgi:hypothetical protein
MNYTVITGMSKSYFDNIGKTMLESWITFWPENFSITVYTEDLEELQSFKNPRINFISLDTFSEGYREFQKKDFKKLNSRIHTFSKKAWPIIENLKSNSGKLIWIDADAFFYNDANNIVDIINNNNQKTFNKTSFMADISQG